MEQLASELERLNPNKNALASPLINAKWRLLYTTSASILGTTKPPFLRPQGPIYQTIDAVNLVAKNEETWPFFNQVRYQMAAGVWTPMQHLGAQSCKLLWHLSSILVTLVVSNTSFSGSLYLVICTLVSVRFQISCHTECLSV